MSVLAVPGSTIATPRLRDLVIAGLLVLAALATLYLVFFYQGNMLSAVYGDTSFNFLHEFAHDGRHLFGLPCH